MFKRTVRGAVALVLASTGTAAMAQSLAWQLTEVSGAVTIRHGTEQRAAARGTTLQPGDAIMTGAGGRAVMVHERDFVTLASNSRATVPGAAAQATGFTKLLQDLGNAVYKIEKRGVPHFGVTTPYLAAVVKGTTFSITVDQGGSALQVVEGAVEVQTPDGGARDLILPGGVATVSASDVMRLTVHGDSDRTIDSPARSTATPAAQQGTVENGATPQTSNVSPNADAVPLHDAAMVEVAAETNVIAVPVAAHPVDLAGMSDGLVTGTAGFTALTKTVTQSVNTSSPASAALIATPAAAGATPVPVIAAAAPASPVVATASPVPTTSPATIATPATIDPAASASVIALPAVTAPTIIATAAPTPVLASPLEALPIASTPVLTAPAATVPAAGTPVASTPAITAPAITTPAVTPPAVTTPGLAPPVVSTPIVTAPVSPITTVSTPVVTAPVATVPIAATPITTPVATAPIVATPVTVAPVVTTPVTTTSTASSGGLIGSILNPIVGTVTSTAGKLLGQDDSSSNNGTSGKK